MLVKVAGDNTEHQVLTCTQLLQVISKACTLCADRQAYRRTHPPAHAIMQTYMHVMPKIPPPAGIFLRASGTRGPSRQNPRQTLEAEPEAALNENEVPAATAGVKPKAHFCTVGTSGMKQSYQFWNIPSKKHVWRSVEHHGSSQGAVGGEGGSCQR